MSRHWMLYKDLKETRQHSASLNTFILQDQTVFLKVQKWYKNGTYRALLKTVQDVILEHDNSGIIVEYH